MRARSVADDNDDVASLPVDFVGGYPIVRARAPHHSIIANQLNPPTEDLSNFLGAPRTGYAAAISLDAVG